MSTSAVITRPGLAAVRARVSLTWGRVKVAYLTAAIAALVFIPWLGSVGLWDPWETHYSEVGRQMLVRGDWIHPYWEQAWFFSKPALTPWLAALGLFVADGASAHGELGRYTEWAIRLPFAVLAITAVSLLSHAVGRLASHTAGITCGFVLATMPLFFFTARQAMTDMPFVATVTIAWACALLGQLDAHASAKARRFWWLGFYAAMGISALGKGLLSGLPAVGWVLFWLLTRSRNAVVKTLKAQVQQMELLRGTLLFCVIALPWYVAMIAFEGRDQEGLVFWQRFFVHDHFNRLVAGVYTTTPGGTFVYFIEQAGFGIFPWVAFLPGAMTELTQTSAHEENPRAQLTIWAGVTALLAFVLFSASATKFHHYILPALPAVAVLIGLFAARLIDDGPGKHALALLVGLGLFGLVGKDLVSQPRHWVDLFTFNYDRPYPEFLLTQSLWGEAPAWLNFKIALAMTLTAGCVASIWAGSRQSARGLLIAATAVALALALALSWGHWVSLSHHWTQRDLFSRYWKQRGPHEPIAVFYMDWKGETFYSRNEVLQLKPANTAVELPAYLARPGRKWMLTEHVRVNALRSLIGPSHSVRLVEPALNNKFVLITID